MTDALNQFLLKIERDAENIEFLPLGKTKESDKFSQVISAVNYVYPSFVNHLRARPFTKDQIITAFSFCYAWQEKKQTLTADSAEESVDIFKEISSEIDKISNKFDPDICKKLLAESSFETLATQGGNSLTVASKMLHLFKPSIFAILDVHVLGYVYKHLWKKGKTHKSLLKELKHKEIFYSYWAICHNLTQHPKAQSIKGTIDKKLEEEANLDYLVSKMRAIELVMYYTSKKEALEKEHNKS